MTNTANTDWQKLEKCCTVIWGGKTWQAELTEALGMANSNGVRAWKQRGVPDKIWGQLRIIASDKIKDISDILIDI